MTKIAELKDTQSAQSLPWQTARDKHIRNLRIDQTIKDETSAEHYRYSEIFLEAANSKETKVIHKPAFLMLSAIMTMRIPCDEFESKLLQFEPLVEFYGVGRFAIPSDFSSEQIETIRKCAKKTKNLVVKTRLEHLVWSLDRRDIKAGQRAIDGYIETLEAIYCGSLCVRSDLDLLGATSTRTLKVLISINRNIKSQISKEKNVERIAKKFFYKSIESKDVMCIIRFGEVAAQIDKADTIRLVEKFINRSKPKLSYALAGLWGLLASVYNASNNTKRYNSCKKKKAEIYIALAKKYIRDDKRSAYEIASILKDAFRAYSNVPNVRRERTSLRKMLVNIEKKIPAEMMRTGRSVNVEKLAHSVIKKFKNLSLSEALMQLKSENISLDFDEIKRSAVERIMQLPLRYSGYSEMTDDAGKTIAITKGVNIEEGEIVKGNLDPAIMHCEECRRGYFETGFIAPARVEISQSHRVSREKISDILRFSPTVPPQYRHTLSAGFEYYFNQDWTASAYILIPMLEGILRQGLIWGGYDVLDLGEADSDQDRLVSLSNILNMKSTELANVYSREVVEDMYRLFCTKWGPSVRHRAVHALHNGNIHYARDVKYACWLIWKVATLNLYVRIE